MKKDFLTFTIPFFLIVWFGFLLFRSVVFVKRIIGERKNSSTTSFFSEVKPCSAFPGVSNGEKYHVWLYRNLGENCSKK